MSTQRTQVEKDPGVAVAPHDYSSPEPMPVVVAPQETAAPTKSVFRKIWNGWLKVAHVIGTIQMMIILTIVYWVMIPIIAIPFLLLSDPLFKNQKRARWIKRESTEYTVENMKNQY